MPLLRHNVSANFGAGAPPPQEADAEIPTVGAGGRLAAAVATAGRRLSTTAPFWSPRRHLTRTCPYRPPAMARGTSSLVAMSPPILTASSASGAH